MCFHTLAAHRAELTGDTRRHGRQTLPLCFPHGLALACLLIQKSRACMHVRARASPADIRRLSNVQ